MAVDSSPIPQDTLWKLRQAETTLPYGPQGYDGTYVDIATAMVPVNGQKWYPVASPFTAGQKQTVTGWKLAVGGGTYSGYDLDGNFTGQWYADNSWKQFVEAATLPALAYGVHLSGVTAGAGALEAAGWESGTLASGVTVGGPMGAGAQGLTATQLAPWAATAAAGGGAAAAASSASSLASLGKGVAGLAAAGMSAKPGQASTITPENLLKQQPPGTPGTIAGFPVETVLIVGAILAAALS